ncbi:hypothetical protein KUTeg_008591 [Tegillarca granosa]|uniref:Uncharacterized protein n=1 Tax=Tegillarca granosa TaxID=220873 RepID=A0ABQ9F9L9_TEGGR|nr:hypothetical protein KUTeg_008591 [Tegillarca granosa]
MLQLSFKLNEEKDACNVGLNNHHLHKIPMERKDLGELESLSKNYIFQNGQSIKKTKRGIIGSFVNVPIDTEVFVHHCLELLTRLTSYKGCHLHQNTRPNHGNDALIWLVNHNELYKNINVTRDLLQQCQDDNSELLTSLFNDGTDLHNDGNEEDESICQENSSFKEKNIQTTASVENNDQQHQCDDIVSYAIQDPQEKCKDCSMTPAFIQQTL